MWVWVLREGGGARLRWRFRRRSSGCGAAGRRALTRARPECPSASSLSMAHSSFLDALGPGADAGSTEPASAGAGMEQCGV